MSRIFLSPALAGRVERVGRREFLRRTMAVGVSAGCLGSLGLRADAAESRPLSAAAAAMPIVDTHQHLWDVGKLQLPWLQSAGPLRRSFLTKDYLEAAAGLGVVKAVYMEVDVGPNSKQAEADYILALCRRGDSPTVAAVVGGYPAADDFRRYVSQFKGSPYIKGIRQIVTEPGPFADAKFRRGIQLLGELGMSFDLCQPMGLLPEAARLADACPGTRFILDHCGNASVQDFLPAGHEPVAQLAARRSRQLRWWKDIAAIARRKNVVCKISGIAAGVPKGYWAAENLQPIVDHCLEAFGPDRVMFAGDWPICTRGATLRQWVEALEQIVRGRSPIDQRKLFHDNAVRVYGLAAK